jgi:hypothetical protein
MRRPGVLACLLVCLTVPSLAAQSSMRDKIAELLTYGVCGEPLCLDLDGQNTFHGDHFIPAVSTGAGTIQGFLNDAIALNASNFPISGTSGGLTVKFVGGLPVKTSSSLGPVFGERAQTLGRGRFLMGANLSGIRFKTLRGVPIDNMTLNFTHQDIGNPGLGDLAYENDLVQVRMSLFVDLLVSSFFATYGLFDGVDLSVAVPLVNTSLKGRSTAQILQIGGTSLHYFGGTAADPILQSSTATFGSATGIGDVATRLKIRLFDGENLAMAVLGDVRWATGDEEQLLGAGKSSFRGLAIFSSRFGSFNPHVNVGYFYRNSDAANDAFILNGGFDQALNDWTTLAVDILSEWQVGDSKFELPPTVDYVLPAERSITPLPLPDKADNRMNASLGFKFKFGGASTLVTNAQVPLLRGGLQPNVIWTTGLEFNF